jgi:hypothetical protein
LHWVNEFFGGGLAVGGALVRTSNPSSLGQWFAKARNKSVGDKAYALANDGTKEVASLQWIEQGAAAECKLKYLSGK